MTWRSHWRGKHNSKLFVHASRPVIQSTFTCCPCIEMCYSKYTCLTFDIRQFIHTLCNHVSFFHLTPHWCTVKQNTPSAVPHQIVSKLTNPPDNTTPFQTVIRMCTPSYVVMTCTCWWFWIRTLFWMSCSLLALQLLWTQRSCYALLCINCNNRSRWVLVIC